ncbi:MAG: TIGR03557 family F420-dependent LLM class oxidoreductase [Actinomycetota bacterium]
MAAVGYTLSSEEHPPQDLVRNARRAEELGFGFVSISDHYHPWVSAQGHSPFVWSVLGGIAATTQEIEVAVGVTCPIVRIHPAILAQASATTALLLEGRFTFGVGTGEALNEHVLGHRWPRPEVRLAMLEEAVEVIRRLWTGETVDHHGAFYEVDNARLFDPPEEAPPIVVSGFGQEATKLAARIGDGYWGHSPEAELLDLFASEGGRGPRYAQINLCWSDDADKARRTVHEIWPNGGVVGQLSQDLPTFTHFEQAAQMVAEDDATSSVPCGNDVGAVVEAVQQFVDAGYDHVYLHQIGPDQDAFLDAWRGELGQAVRELSETT